MNFTWDIVLNAKRHGTDESELFFRPAKDRSPWYEQAFPILNETRAEGPEIEYNPLYRFDAMFHDMLREDFTESPIFQEYLFDAVSHFLVQVDLHHGLTKRAFYVRCLMREMENGGFGPSIAAHLQAVDLDKVSPLHNSEPTSLLSLPDTAFFLEKKKIVPTRRFIYMLRGKQS